MDKEKKCRQAMRAVVRQLKTAMQVDYVVHEEPSVTRRFW
jgi:hypothetical protein